MSLGLGLFLGGPDAVDSGSSEDGMLAVLDGAVGAAYDFTAGETLWTNTAPADDPAEISDPVRQADDIGPNGADAVALSDSRRPTRQASGVLFGPGAVLSRSLSATNPYMFVCFKWDAVATGSQSVVSELTYNGSNNGAIGIYRSGTSLLLTVGYGGSFTATGTIAEGPCVVSVQFDTSDATTPWAARVNGSPLALTPGTDNRSSTGNILQTDFHFGGRGSGTMASLSTFGRYFVARKLVSGGEIPAVEAWADGA
tara:strand:- start:9674 stop:10438 length:765 start_codon:yes stop_codon:yes gene_type:complete